VRKPSRHRGPWPRVSVWHGGADATVIPPNATEIIKQWVNVHCLPAHPSFDGTVDGYPRVVWTNPEDDEVIETCTISGTARRSRRLQPQRISAELPDPFFSMSGFHLLSHFKIFGPSALRGAEKRLLRSAVREISADTDRAAGSAEPFDREVLAPNLPPSSKQRPRAIEATRSARLSERIGHTRRGALPAGRRISRRRVDGVQRLR
jgi:hypothetical protein